MDHVAMDHLVLTVVGDDRPGLVKALADVVVDHDGNWERSEFSELAGAFAGIVLVRVPSHRTDALVDAMQGLDGMLRVSVHARPQPTSDSALPRVTISVLGNDQPGIVQELSSVIEAHGASIDGFTSHTREAPMAGGTLFDATITVRMSGSTDAATVTAALERVAQDLQVDLTIG